MKGQIRRNYDFQLPSYRDAVEHLTKHESDVELRSLISQIFSVSESKVIDDVLKMRPYVDGQVGMKPTPRRRNVPSYQRAVFFVNPEHLKEVQFFAALYHEKEAKVIRDARKTQTVIVPEPKAAPGQQPRLAQTSFEKASAKPLQTKPPGSAQTQAPGDRAAVLKRWRCGYCGTLLADKEVFLHYQKFHINYRRSVAAGGDETTR